jgi:serine/threonine-protein kinase
MGTPAYMSPEQLRATSEVDERSDIWSLGVLLYELCTGDLPFDDESVQNLCVKVMRDPWKPISVEMPEGVETVITRCLQKEPDHRFPKVSALAIALAPFAERKDRLDRVLRVQPLSMPPIGMMKPEDVPPYRPPGAPTQAAVVTDTALDFDDEDPFKKKRGGWSLFGFGAAGALVGGAILVGVALYAGNQSNAPAAATHPPSAEATPAAPEPPVPSATTLTSDDSAPSASTVAAKPGARPPGKRPAAGAGGTKPAARAAGSAQAATSASSTKPAVDPEKLLETR